MSEEIDNSPDDKLTESEALKNAKDEDIYFTDEFSVVEIETRKVVGGPYKTRAEAEKDYTSYDPDLHTIQQSRTRVQ